jgi:hypothetical protein
MPELHVILEGDGAWPDLAERLSAPRHERKRAPVIHLGNDAPPIQMSGLEDGMSSGAPSVIFRLDLPDGTTVLAETSWRLFAYAFWAFAARFGEERPDLTGMEVIGDWTGAGPQKLRVLPGDEPWVVCELCGKKREVDPADPETAREALQWLYRHFQEEHPGWTPPAQVSG